MTFSSKIDVWVWLILSVFAAAMLFAAFSLLTQTAAVGPISLVLAVMGLSLALMLWIVMTTQYTVQNDVLRVRSGPFTWQIPISSIRQVKQTRNPLSSPALSLDRLEVSYGEKKKILVSPKNRSGFLQAINHPIEA